MICLFVRLGVFVPLIWRRHHYRWRIANFDLCSALMVIEQWGFFSVPHPLWLGATYIMVISEDPWHSHLHLERLAVELSLPVYDLGLSRLGFEHPTFLLRGEGFNPLHHHCDCFVFWREFIISNHHVFLHFYGPNKKFSHLAMCGPRVWYIMQKKCLCQNINVLCDFIWDYWKAAVFIFAMDLLFLFRCRMLFEKLRHFYFKQLFSTSDVFCIKLENAWFIS